MVKSAVWITQTVEALGRASGPIAPPEKTWVDQILQTATDAKAAAASAEESKTEAENAKDQAREYMLKAQQCQNRAEAAVERYPQIGENGNWFVWNAAAGAYVDTGRFSGGNAPYIGANGNWFIGTEDSGVSATGPVGPAYVLTEADKAEIVDEVLAALPNAEEADF